MYKRLSILAVATCLAAAGANAATFDFEADADAFWGANIGGSAKYEGTFDQVYGISTIDANARANAAGTNGGNTDDGITVMASATNALGAADPFMDSGSAGLGVCSSGLQSSGISECSSGSGNNTGDDNLFSPELLELSFSESVFLESLQIRDADHNLINNQVDAILINGSSYGTGANGLVDLSLLGGGDTFTFTSSNSGKEIYLSVMQVAAVPIPASLPLMVGGLGLLGWTARRRRRK